MKIVIIGGVAGGATAAARLRRLDEEAEIIILERSGYISYANCGLPYYIGGVIQKKRALSLQTPERFFRRFRIEARTRHEAISIDAENKTVTVKALDEDRVYTESYDKLILSPGAKAIKPNWSSIDDPRIFRLRTVEDTSYIHEFIEKNAPKKAVVIGSGFIGIEMAENLISVGVETVLLELGDQVLPPLDFDMACSAKTILREKGLDLRLEETVEGFAEQNGRLLVLIKGKEGIETDMAILAIGVIPDTQIASEAGLELGLKGAIRVNERMETSKADIYAVGDAIQVKHFVTGQETLIPLAGPANKEGRIAADNIFGLNSRFKGAQGTSIIKIFELTAASTGINEKTAKALKIPYDKVILTQASHATYYPGSAEMTIKTIFSPTDGKILGAQIFGFDGVDKRIDVLSTAIRAGMTAADLAELELAYAPPYSSAKDPINMTGFVIENLLNGLVKQIHWQDIEKLPKDGSVTLLDVRSNKEFAAGCIPGAINIPLDELRENMVGLDQSKTHYVYCRTALRSYVACRVLAQYGFDCYNLSGGFTFYQCILGKRTPIPDPF